KPQAQRQSAHDLVGFLPQLECPFSRFAGTVLQLSRSTLGHSLGLAILAKQADIGVLEVLRMAVANKVEEHRPGGLRERRRRLHRPRFVLEHRSDGEARRRFPTPLLHDRCSELVSRSASPSKARLKGSARNVITLHRTCSRRQAENFDGLGYFPKQNRP